MRILLLLSHMAQHEIVMIMMVLKGAEDSNCSGEEVGDEYMNEEQDYECRTAVTE